MTSYLHVDYMEALLSILLQRVTSLRRRVPTAASYWLRRVLDDGGRQDWLDESIVQRGAGRRGGACNALLYTIILIPISLLLFHLRPI